MKASKLTKKQLLGLLKVAVYIGVSAVLSYLVTLTTDSPEFFGVLTPVINLGLVALRDLFRED